MPFSEDDGEEEKNEEYDDLFGDIGRKHFSSQELVQNR